MKKTRSEVEIAVPFLAFARLLFIFLKIKSTRMWGPGN